MLAFGGCMAVKGRTAARGNAYRMEQRSSVLTFSAILTCLALSKGVIA